MANLNEILCRWQKLLYLQDWEIKIMSVQPHEMACNTRLAEVEYSLTSKEAYIRVCHPNPALAEFAKQDIEASVVHELLHLHFTGLQEDMKIGTADHFLHEIAINQVSKALVNLWRRK